MILFKRNQLTQEYFLQHTNEKGIEGKDIYLRETITMVEYFDKEVTCEAPEWYKVSYSKKNKVTESQKELLETEYQKNLNETILKEQEKEKKRIIEKGIKELTTNKKERNKWCKKK